MAECLQEPRFHGEGDVWTHTRLACEALAASAAFRGRPPDERALLFTAVLLHDIGKPNVTRTEPDGTLSSRGHSRRGALLARQILWQHDAPFEFREQVAALIRHHQVPFHLLDDANPVRKAITVSQTARCDLLAIVAEADARGRICDDQGVLLESVSLFEEQCRELACLRTPYQFASDHARFEYFRHEDRDPAYAAFDDTRVDVVLMSGLPGAGKDRWLSQNLRNWPVISLDQIRQELGVHPEESQGTVVSHARERLRGYLRRRERVAWNATNLSRDMRSRTINVCADYGARVRLVYVEVPRDTLFAQNRERAHPIPETAIERLLDRWDVPDLTEAHRVDYCVRQASGDGTVRAAGAVGR